MTDKIADELRALKGNTTIFMGELQKFARAAAALDAKDKQIAELEAALEQCSRATMPGAARTIAFKALARSLINKEEANG